MMETVLSRSVRLVFAGGVAVGLGLVAQSALAQEAKSDTQRVEITGSSIKRTSAETALPISVVKREDIERSGATTAQDLIKMIPSNFGGTVVASNVGATGIASTANLRQLGEKYTLVLLNGRRIANYAFGNSPVDLNSIPVSAIERIEVLRDGASALYGADAIAGVINFILRSDYTGAEATIFTTHNSQSGGGNTRSINFTGGFGNLNTQNFNVLLSVNHEENQKLAAKDRSFANTAKRDDLGINNSSSRNGIPNINFTDTRGNEYTGINPYRYKNCDSTEFALVVRDETTCGTDYVKFIDLIPKADHDNIVGRAVYKVNNDVQVYTEYSYTKDKLQSAYSPAPFTNPFNGYPANGRFYPTSITLPKGMTLPAGYVMPNGSKLTADTVLNDDLAVTPTGIITGRWRTVAGGGRNDITETENTRWLLGSKGTMWGWDYDTAFSYAKNKGTISFGPGQYSYAKLTPLLESGAINIFGGQDAASKAALDSAQLFGNQRTASSESKEIDISLSKELAKMTHGTLALGIGGSIRKEDLNQFSFPVLASGDPVGGDGPVPGVVGSRKVYGLFAELQVPVYKDLQMQLAARYDNLKNDFGTSFSKISPKVSLTYKPTNELMFRGSYGQGFRAPTLYENLRPFTSAGATAGSFSDPIRCPNGVKITNTTTPVGVLQDECKIQLSTANQGDQNLSPEKSKQYSLGVVFQIAKNFSGTIDYWNVDIQDAIQQKPELQVLSNPDANQKYFYRYDPAQFPKGWQDDGKHTGAIAGSTNPNFPLAYVYLPIENTASIFAAGIDINLNYNQKVEGWGKFGVNFDGSLYTKHGYQYPGLPSVSDNGSYKDLGSVPRWRHATTVSWAYQAWNASLTHNYTSSYEDFTDPASVGGTNYPATRTVSAYQTFDSQVTWTGIKNLDVTFGVHNIADTEPPSSRKSSGFQVGYDEKNVNPIGRQFYLRAKYKF